MKPFDTINGHKEQIKINVDLINNKEKMRSISNKTGDDPQVIQFQTKCFVKKNNRQKTNTNRFANRQNDFYSPKKRSYV